MTQAATTSPAPDSPQAVNPDALRELVIEPKRGWIAVDWSELFRHRDLLGFLIWRDFKVRYKQTVLGLGWAILQPLFFMLVFWLVGASAGIDTGTVPKPVFYFAGLLPWTFFAVGVQLSSQCLVNQQHLLTKVYLPRLFIPTSVIIVGLIDLLVASAMLAIIMAIYQVMPPAQIAMAVPLLALLLAFTLGVGYLFSALTVAYRDLRYIVPFFVQAMMFLSPVIYPVTMFGDNVAWVLKLNPMTAIIESFRAAVTGTPIDWIGLGMGAAVAIVTLFVGLAVFRRIERRFADIA
ncbi:MAG: transport permease protein [Phycisphaeraceae bacterium]|nr:MAG: transport permease protein [Phycisphaeraceae bacterium]